MTNSHILIAAGGTGGHVFPGVAVAQALAARDAQVTWLGSEDGKEVMWVKQQNIPLRTIPVKPLRGHGLKYKAQFPMQLWSAVRASLKVIADIKPDVVLGMGGFVSGPAGIAAKLAGIPLLIHEQNTIPGLTNKVLAYLAKQVLCAFPTTFTNLGYKRIYIGNPVRQQLVNLQKSEHSSTPQKLLVLGGSLGAKVFNDVLPQAIAILTKEQRPEIWHQTGLADVDKVQQAYASLGITAKVSAFIDDMSAAYAFADIVLSRAGATTIAELMTVGLPCLLVPLPHAADDHQTHNARFLVDQGQAILIPQSDFDATHFAVIWRRFFEQAGLLSKMHQHSALIMTTAAAQIANLCLENKLS